MIKILRQPLVRQEFPLKLACALDARYRRRRSQNEVASESDPIHGVKELRRSSSWAISPTAEGKSLSSLANRLRMLICSDVIFANGTCGISACT
eukprot:s103_g25.t1